MKRELDAGWVDWVDWVDSRSLLHVRGVTLVWPGWRPLDWVLWVGYRWSEAKATWRVARFLTDEQVADLSRREFPEWGSRRVARRVRRRRRLGLRGLEAGTMIVTRCGRVVAFGKVEDERGAACKACLRALEAGHARS